MAFSSSPRVGWCRSTVFLALSFPLLSCGGTATDRRNRDGTDITNDTGGQWGTGAESGSGAEPGSGGSEATAGGTSGNSGGEGGSLGVGGTSGNGGEPNSLMSCTSTSGEGQKPWHDLSIKGTNFDDENGHLVRVFVHVDGAYRSAIAETPVENGAFEIEIPECLNDMLYVNVALYFDRNGDNGCDEEEHLLSMTTGIVMQDYLMELTPTTWCTTDAGGSCSDIPMQYSPCNSNGRDLEAPVSCE